MDIFALQMSYDVSDAKKLKAEKTINYFTYLLKSLKKSESYLDIMLSYFKKHPDITPEDFKKYRAIFRKYRDSSLDNFNDFKRISFKCFVSMQPFSSDVQISKLIKTFTLSVSDVEKQVNRFAELFADLENADADLSQSLVKGIENIKKETSQLYQIIDDRIIAYIQTNILARTWVDNIGQELNEKIEDVPTLIEQLVNMRSQKDK